MRLYGKTLLLLVLMTAAVALLTAQSVKFSVSPTQLRPGEKGTLRATLTIPPELEKKQSYDPGEGEGSYLYVTGEHPDLSFGSTQYPKADHVSEAGIWEYYGPLILSLPFTVKANASPGVIKIQTAMSYGLCHKVSGFCDVPDEVPGSVHLTILAAEAVAETSADAETSSGDTVVTAEAVVGVEVETTGEDSAAKAQDTATTTSKILFYMLMAILGGIVLNFTPCVLPILPIRAMSMVNQAQKDVTKVFLHTMAYATGVLISFGAIAAVFIIARVSGVNLTYGFLSQSLSYNLIMLSILFLFGLSLLGVFEMTVPGMSAAGKATAKKGYTGSFFMGIFAFLMGFSCMGPFMGPALEVAVRLSSPLLLVFFLLIGFGFALPFIIISLFPKALKLIPKPGTWMNIFKEVMGFLLLLLVWKYFSNIWGLTKSGSYLLDTAHYMVFLGFAAWLYGRFVRMEHSKAVQFIFSFLTLAVIVWSAYNYLPWQEKHEPPQTEVALVDGMQPADHPGWYVFSPELFHRLQSEGKTVFLDIGAAWCTNCKVNERKVLHTEDIMADFARHEVVLLKGDFTREDPVLKDWIQKGGSIGVPFNVLYIPGQEPIKMSELFSKEDLRRALAQIPAKEDN
ncbi:MAG: thioredoxin family protein [Candidatus Syntrophosphaera sp.]|nr:thioredoxin family protein [Candidatus Syntrophosphaera sp.]